MKCDMVRVRLRVDDPESWHGQKQEGVWVKLVKALDGRAIVEICNIPFCSNSVAMGDKIIVGLHNGEVTFQSVAERGGHSTYRIFIEDPGSFDMVRLKALEALGCGWEQTTWGDGDLYAIDIPPEADFDEVCEVLAQGRRDGVWICDEGYAGHSRSKYPPA